MWLSLFPVRSSGTSDRPAGLYGVAFVDYQDGGVLRYRELLVARLVRDGSTPRVHVTDMWVDSVTSRDGGRSLWAMPKDLADFHIRDRNVGPTMKTSCDAIITGAPVATARITGGRMPTLRTPFTFTTAQQREDGETVVAKVSGSAKSLPCLAKWGFGADGPLAWLAGRQPVVSFRMSDFRLSFGA